MLFYTINRNKESFAANLKDSNDSENVKKLIAKADIMTHNFRPGVMEKMGLSFQDVIKINPKIIYGVITGYGEKGPWASKPGQDLLVQSLSGLTWLSGKSIQGPVPFGLAVADLMCGNHFVQGILAALLKRAKTGKGVLVEVSLLESILDVQFEALTIFLNNGGKLANRGNVRGSAHAFLSAPYGIYETSDGYLALAMGDLLLLGSILEVDLARYTDKKSWFKSRAAIRKILSKRIITQPSDYWIKVLREKALWCEKVLDYKDLNNQPFMNDLKMKQTVINTVGVTMVTTRSPIQIDGNIIKSEKAAPKVGEDNEKIYQQFLSN